MATTKSVLKGDVMELKTRKAYHNMNMPITHIYSRFAMRKTSSQNTNVAHCVLNKRHNFSTSASVLRCDLISGSVRGLMHRSPGC